MKGSFGPPRVLDLQVALVILLHYGNSNPDLDTFYVDLKSI